MTVNKSQQSHLNKHFGDPNAETDRWKTNKERWQPYNHNQEGGGVGAGKGDKPRPTSCSPEEYGLRYDLATGRITMEEFEKRMEELNG